MWGITANAGYGNKPNGRLQGGTAGETDIVNHILNKCQEKNSPGCTNPYNVNNNTAFLDSAASLYLLGHNEACKRSKVKKSNITLGTPSKQTIMTTETLEILLEKLTEEARKDFRVPDIPHNLIAACELVNAGCSVHLYQHECEIEYEGGTLYPGWRDKPSRLRIMGLNYEGENIITPYTAPE